MSAPYTRHGFLLWHQILCRGRWAGQPPRWVHCWLRWWWSRRCRWSKWSRCQNAPVQLCHPPSRPLPQTWTWRKKGQLKLTHLTLEIQTADCPPVQVCMEWPNFSLCFWSFDLDCTIWANSRWQHLCEQLLRFLFLDLQLLSSLSDQLLQVRRVLLQHPQHGVYDVCLLSLIDVLKLRGHHKRQGRKYRERGKKNKN